MVAHVMGALMAGSWSALPSPLVFTAWAAPCPDIDMFTVPIHEDLWSPEHLPYPHSGMPAQAAAFVAGKL